MHTSSSGPPARRILWRVPGSSIFATTGLILAHERFRPSRNACRSVRSSIDDAARPARKLFVCVSCRKMYVTIWGRWTVALRPKRAVAARAGASAIGNHKFLQCNHRASAGSARVSCSSNSSIVTSYNAGQQIELRSNNNLLHIASLPYHCPFAPREALRG